MDVIAEPPLALISVQITPSAGFVHNALADLTGYVPELLITKKGHQV